MTIKTMMMKFKAGDEVTVLDDSFNGRVKDYKDGRVVIETPEGFELEFEEKELVKINNAGELKSFISSQSLGAALKDKQEPLVNWSVLLLSNADNVFVANLYRYKIGKK